MKNGNRRERTRIQGSHPVQLRRRGHEHDQADISTLLDVSTGGAQLTASVPMFPGEPVAVELSDRDGSGINLPATVIWCEPSADSSYHLGIEFLDRLSRKHFIRLSALACGAAALR